MVVVFVWDVSCTLIVGCATKTPKMRLKYRKFAVIGFRGVGKSSLLSQFVDRNFTEEYDPTVQNTYGKTVKVDDQLYRLELLDTAGQDELSDLPQNVCMNVDGWILVYSVTSNKSFEVLANIHEQLEDKMGGMLKIPIVLVGNKIDLNESRVVKTEDGVELARQWRGTFIEASAKENKNVSEIFSSALRQHHLLDAPKKKRHLRLCFCL